MNERDVQIYSTLLKSYLKNGDPSYLKKAVKMSESFLDRRLYPEDIMQMHMRAMESIASDYNSNHKNSLMFLFEAMYAYLSEFEKYIAIKEERSELMSEIKIAAHMQETLLATDKPVVDGVDIGAISVPYHQMNGDYFHFDHREDNVIGISIADVIGKGIPAALSMSMIKYSLDIFYDDWMSANGILRYLNRVVERNITSNMFITMFYGQYFPEESVFRYASAGHEPGFIYRAADESFTRIDARGIVLGVLPDAQYKEFKVKLEKDDMIVLLTDGVTECRKGESFITCKELTDIIKMYNHLPAQEQVEHVYAYLDQTEEYQLKDDFTLIILKRLV